jgi:hypothetical protein
MGLRYAGAGLTPAPPSGAGLAPLFSPEIDFRAVRGSTHIRHPKNLPMKALIRAIQAESMSLSTLEALAKWRNVRLVKVLEMCGEEIPASASH